MIENVREVCKGFHAFHKQLLGRSLVRIKEKRKRRVWCKRLSEFKCVRVCNEMNRVLKQTILRNEKYRHAAYITYNLSLGLT